MSEYFDVAGCYWASPASRASENHWAKSFLNMTGEQAYPVAGEPVTHLLLFSDETNIV